MIADTSMKAFKAIYDTLGEKQQAVYEAIKELGTASNEEVAQYLGVQPHVTSGRFTELKKFGMIQVEGLTIGKSGHSAKTYSIADLNDRQLEKLSLDCA